MRAVNLLDFSLKLVSTILKLYPVLDSFSSRMVRYLPGVMNDVGFEWQSSTTYVWPVGKVVTSGNDQQ